MLFVLRQASYRFGIAQRVLGFEGCQAGQRLLFCRLLPDANEFGLHVTSFSSRDRIEYVALLMDQTALTRRGRKLFGNRSQQPLMPIGHEQIDVRSPSWTQIVQQASPSIFVLLGAGS